MHRSLPHRQLRKVSDIKYSHLQTVIDGMNRLSYASKKKVRNLLSLLFAYARKMEYTFHDFTGLIRIGKNKPVNPHQAMSKQAINRLWKLVDKADVDIVLILIYTGMRTCELRNLKKTDINRRQKYIRITKSKTEAFLSCLCGSDLFLLFPSRGRAGQPPGRPTGG